MYTYGASLFYASLLIENTLHYRISLEYALPMYTACVSLFIGYSLISGFWKNVQVGKQRITSVLTGIY